jgi:hypothetical protein
MSIATIATAAVMALGVIGGSGAAASAATPTVPAPSTATHVVLAGDDHPDFCSWSDRDRHEWWCDDNHGDRDHHGDDNDHRGDHRRDDRH